MLTRIKLVLLFGGGVLSFLGFQEYQLSRGTSVEPEKVELAELESSGIPENPHLELGPHWAIYAASVYEYRQGRFETGEPDDSAKVTHTYYPVISDEHPFIQAIAALEERYGNLAEAPEAEFPELEGGIAVLVKTQAFKTIGAIPDGFDRADGVRGMVINRIDGLDAEERKLVAESFPNLDFDKLAILEQDRSPAAAGTSLSMMGGGVLLSLLGLGWMAQGFLKRD